MLEHREYLRDLVLPLPQGGAPPMLPPGAGLEAAPPRAAAAARGSGARRTT